MNCRHCNAPLTHDFLDLGVAPPSNAYLEASELDAPETWFPLHVLYCDQCWLVQTADFAERELLFSKDYAYFSSMSSSWVAHAQRYAKEIIQRLGLSASSRVVEIASNDGYLLRHFQNAGIPCLGVEPTAACAQASRSLGIETVEEFFGVDLAAHLKEQGYTADLMVANNVLAHVPDINDFTAGFTTLLADDGIATFEFPHFLHLVEGGQFDTIYHEHFSYLSLTAVARIFDANGLEVFDVEQLSTHGGSLRVFAQRKDTGRRPLETSVEQLLEQERAAGMTTHAFYDGFQGRAEKIRNDFISFLIEARRQGKRVAAYGAAAKGNTLLNFAGIKRDLLAFVVDKSPLKVGRFMPGSRIPIVSEERITEYQPDYVVILPWNIADEVEEQLDYVRGWGGRFVTAIPEIVIR